MKKTILPTVAVLLTAFPMAFAQEVTPGDKSVAFKTPEGNYLSSVTGSGVDISGTKIGSKETYLVADVNGGELVEGDGIIITQVTTAEGGVKRVKGWKIKEAEVRRGDEPATFTLKKSGEQWVLQVSEGQFLGATGEAKRLAPVATMEAAVKFDIVAVPATTASAPTTAASPAPAATPAASPAATVAPSATPAPSPAQ